MLQLVLRHVPMCEVVDCEILFILLILFKCIYIFFNEHICCLRYVRMTSYVPSIYANNEPMCFLDTY